MAKAPPKAQRLSAPQPKREAWSGQHRDKRIRGRKGQALRRARLKRTHGLCEDCLTEGRSVPATVVDHTVPLALGGEDIDDNTRNLCDAHHDKRTAEQFGRNPKPEIGTDGWHRT